MKRTLEVGRAYCAQISLDYPMSGKHFEPPTSQEEVNRQRDAWRQKGYRLWPCGRHPVDDEGHCMGEPSNRGVQA